MIVSGLLIAGGCGSSTPNEKATFDADSQKHAAGWLPAGHAVAAQQDSSACAECHGSDFAGGVSGEACSSCHVNGFPLTATGCTSCHGNPPTGTTVPNRNGAHGTHYALPNMPSECDTCHSGAGSGTVNHNDGVTEVTMLSAYNAKSGAAALNADGTCSNVSCHGGQTTPVWLTGKIDVNTQCLTCHTFGTSQYYGYNSGQHNYHVNVRGWNGECWRCHDYALLAGVHFSSLNTTTLDGQAYLTISSNAGYDKNTGTCVAICHPAYSRVW